MRTAFEQFKNNIKSAEELSVIYHHFVTEMKLPLDLSDILRSQIVYSVSALDKLIHELVRIGMLQSFLGQRPKTLKFNGFTISLETYSKIESAREIYSRIQQAIQSNEPVPLELLSELQAEYFFEQEIIIKHKHLSFQDPDKISDALSLIWEEKQKWQKIASALNMPDDFVKKKLKRIVGRRNQIVHEADIDIQTNLRSSIDENDDAKESVKFIFNLGEAIFNMVV